MPKGRVFLRNISVAVGMVCALACPLAVQAAGDTAVDWYGFFRLDLAYDSALSNNGNYIANVKAHPKDDATSMLSVTARQTRIGMNVKRGNMSGRLEFDFYGTSPENKNALLMRNAYVDLPVGGVSVRAGQDSDLISPLAPATINYFVCWGVGNIGYRRPQLRIYRQQESLYWGMALARNIGADLNGDGTDDGAASGLPALQARVAYRTSGATKLTIGGSGHYGIMDSPGGAEKQYTSWSANGEAKLEVNPKTTIQGEFYTGSNVNAYLGSVLNEDTIDGVASLGGWANLQSKASDRLGISLGGAFDSADEKAIPGNGRSSNMVIFGNGQYDLGSGVKVGLEVSYWTTEYPGPAAGMETKPTDLRVQLAVIGNF